ncbi:TRAP transporter substrate-binding protein [Trueperella pyogenes]|uniref:TRAP transporter substrate-binding protein n=1 Tax=Trueperella pyogenes TaxID=1661 RepID=UPI00312B346C
MKKIVAAISAVTLAFALAACGGSDSKSSSSDEKVSFRIGSNWAQTHPMAKAIDEIFVSEIEKESGGKLKAEVFHSGQLGNEGDLWDGVRNGTIEMVLIGTPMNQEFPKMLISDWPFLYRDLDHAKKVWTGDIAKEMSDSFHEAFPTTYILGWGPNSARTFSSSKKLTGIEDFKGQKFRMPSNEIHIGLAENLGASAQVIPLGDLFTSLETGVVDGQDNGMVTIISEGFNEVQKYVYESNHIVATLEMITSANFLDGLSEENQKIIRTAAAKASEAAWMSYIENVGQERKFLEDKGVTVTAVDKTERERLIDATKPVVDKLIANNDWAEDLTSRIRNVK